MFDLSKMRVLVYDHLQSWNVYRLRKAMDAAERPCPAGFEFVFDHAVANVPAGTVVVHGRSTPGDEPVTFSTTRQRTHEVMERTGREQRPPPDPPEPWRPPAKPPEDRVDRVVWLAGHKRFAEAENTLFHSPKGTCPRTDGKRLLAAAEYFHNQAEHAEAARWLADHSLTCFHEWMSGATSGGEGCAMENEVRRELEALRKILY